MRKLSLLLAIMLLIPISAVPISTASDLPTINAQDELYGLAVDDNGNVITVGQHYDGSKYVMRLQKYNGNNGKISWQTDFDKYATNVGKAVVIHNGYIYAGGVVGHEIAGIPIPQTDYIIVKYDENGNKIVSNTYDNGFADFLMDMTMGGDGYIYATGMTLYIDISSKQLTNVDFWTLKIDPDSLKKVKDVVYDSDIDAAFGIDAKGNDVVVTGAVQQQNSNVSEFFTIKYDNNLNVIWEKEYYQGKTCSASDTAILSDGSIAVTGYEITDKVKVEDFFTILYSSSGEKEWTKKETDDYKDDALSVAVDSHDNIIVGGYRTIKVNNVFHEKWYLIKYGSDGSVKWDKMDNVEGEIKRVVVDANDNIIAAGYKMVGGDEEYCIRKYSPDGDKIWEASSENPSAPLHADFTWTPAQPTRNDYVHFNDLSTGDIQSWQWDFGDGATSNEQSPVHQYTQLGTFTVTLTIKSTTGENSITKNITVVNAPPSADFSYTPLNPVVNDTISFDAGASVDYDGSIVSYAWDFGDGNTSTGKTTSHVYSSSGKYTVTLTITDNDGAVKSIYKYISVNEPGSNIPPIPSFTYSPSSPGVGDTVTFNASASYDEDGTIQLYIWDWGDGSAPEEKTLPSTVHSWNSDGEYTVTLTVRDNNGSENSFSKQIVVGGIGENERLILLCGNIDFMSIEKGEKRSVSVKVMADDFIAKNVSIIILEDGNLTITPLNTIPTLNPGETKEIGLQIKVPENMSEGTVKIKLKAVCNKGVESSEEYVNIVIHSGKTPSFTFVMLAMAALAVVALKYKKKR